MSESSENRAARYCAIAEAKTKQRENYLFKPTNPQGVSAAECIPCWPDPTGQTDAIVETRGNQHS